MTAVDPVGTPEPIPPSTADFGGVASGAGNLAPPAHLTAVSGDGGDLSAGPARRPEVAVGGAFAGGFLVAMLLKRIGS